MYYRRIRRIYPGNMHMVKVYVGLSLVAILLLLNVCSTLTESCATPKTPLIDEEYCLNLVLRSDIPVQVKIEAGFNPIHGKTLLAVLSYKEKPDSLDFNQHCPATFLNAFFIVEGLAATGKHLKCREKVTLDIWVCDQAAKTLVCHEWMLIDESMDGMIDRIEASLIRKTRGNLVIDVQTVPVSAKNRDRFDSLFDKVRETLLKKAGYSSIDEVYLREELQISL